MESWTGADVVAMPDAASVEGSKVHQDCRKALLHRVDQAETSVFHVAPRGAVRAHYHSGVWDLFLGVSGTGQIVYGDGLSEGEVDMRAGSFCAMPPTVPHEVRNTDSTDEFVFVLVHAPYEGYDHLPYDSQ